VENLFKICGKTFRAKWEFRRIDPCISTLAEPKFPMSMPSMKQAGTLSSTSIDLSEKSFGHDHFPEWPGSKFLTLLIGCSAEKLTIPVNGITDMLKWQFLFNYFRNFERKKLISLEFFEIVCFGWLFAPRLKFKEERVTSLNKNKMTLGTNGRAYLHAMMTTTIQKTNSDSTFFTQFKTF
jgi:hypothetical protein